MVYIGTKMKTKFSLKIVFYRNIEKNKRLLITFVTVYGVCFNPEFTEIVIVNEINIDFLGNGNV